jgi:hypothetical protein
MQMKDNGPEGQKRLVPHFEWFEVIFFGSLVP